MWNYFLYMVAGCFWGGSFVAIKYAVFSLPPLVAAWMRVGIALLCLMAICFSLGKSIRIRLSLCPKVWICGFFALGLPFTTLFYAEQVVSAGLAGIINGTTPIWTALIGVVFLSKLEVLSKRQMMGLIVGLLGVLIIFFPSLTEGLGNEQLMGTALCFVMAISYAVAAIYSRHLVSGAENMDVWQNTIHQHIGAFIYLTVVTIIVEGATPDLSNVALSSYLGVLYLAVCSTAIAMLAYIKLIKEWGAVRSTSVLYMVSAIAIFLDFAVFANIPTWNESLGVITALSGVFLIQSKAASSPHSVKSKNSAQESSQSA